jgi:hypothetical protein
MNFGYKMYLHTEKYVCESGMLAIDISLSNLLGSLLTYAQTQT